MMLVFRSVTLSLASMANVSIVVGLFFLIFAIMGVQLFGGRFWSCNDTSVPNKVRRMNEFELALLCKLCCCNVHPSFNSFASVLHWSFLDFLP